MLIPNELKYTADHEWVRLSGDTATVGITDFAQSQLGDIVFVDVPTLGESIAAGSVFGSIEAVKTVSDLLSPVGGLVEEFNAALDEGPEAVNKDPYGAGWIIKVKATAMGDLLTAEEYKKLIS